MAPSAEVHEDASGGPFEGPEKLLELWFQPSAEHVAEMRLPIKGGRRGNPAWTGLRQVDRSVWDGMLSEVECKVLSVIEGEEVDAYLLSCVLHFWRFLSLGAQRTDDEATASRACSYGLTSSFSRLAARRPCF